MSFGASVDFVDDFKDFEKFEDLRFSVKLEAFLKYNHPVLKSPTEVLDMIQAVTNKEYTDDIINKWILLELRRHYPRNFNINICCDNGVLPLRYKDNCYDWIPFEEIVNDNKYLLEKLLDKYEVPHPWRIVSCSRQKDGLSEILIDSHGDRFVINVDYVDESDFLENYGFNPERGTIYKEKPLIYRFCKEFGVDD